MKKTVALFSFFLIALSTLALSSNPDAIVGVWKSGEGTGHIEIYKKGSKYYGKLVWIKEPTNSDGSQKKDINNPKEGLRNRPIINLEILSGFEYEGGNEWESGNIYDPESGNDYSCKMTLKNNSTLEVRGYMGISLFGRTDVWKRVK